MSFFINKLNAIKLVVCFMAIHSALSSQVLYVNDSSYINTLTSGAKANFESFNYSKVDTTLTNFQNYYPRNTSGNIGLPSAPLFLNYEVRSLGFKLYHPPYDNDIISESQVKFMQTKGPYANVTGLLGTKKEQVFRLIFSHTFKNKLNLTVGFNRYGAIGFFKRQQSFNNNFYTSSNYTTKNGRAGYYTYLLFNKVTSQENGGIKNDTLFLFNTRVSKELLPVNLVNASRELRTMSIDVNPWFRINKTEDSSTIFSHFIDYILNYSGNYTKYKDGNVNDFSFYKNVYLDTVATFDSTHWRSVSNAGKYTLKINPLFTHIQIGIKNEYNQVHQYRDSVFMNNSVNTGLFINTKSYNGYLKADYIFEGANQNDYLIEFSNRYTRKIAYDLFKVPFTFNLKVSMEKRHPDFIYNTWVSNHFIWNNNFSPTDKLQGQFSITTTDNRFNIGILLQNVTNQLYFKGNATPSQSIRPIKTLSFFVKKDLLMFKHLGLNGGYTFQSVTNEAIVSVPQNIVSGALYYQGNLFKNALQLQIGFRAEYYSEFYGYNYMPATNVYYIQTSTSVGNYPYIDFFLNARIKPVRIFIKIDHVAQGLLGSNYSLQPHYLQNDRMFKFGINWIFFD